MSWLAILLMLLIGIFLSAFFSGTETGFYRVTRVRLVLDGLGGDFISRILLWLTNNSSLFVASTLIGNNFANCLTSLAIVLGTEKLFPGESILAGIIAPILFAPVIFIYGELLPKSLFFHAPNLLLRRSGPLFLFFCVLFLPLSALLWAMGRFLQWLVGEAPEQTQLTLARNELARVLDEGHAAGILSPSQRHFAQGLFSVANQPVLRFCSPVSRVPVVRLGSSKADALRLARRQRISVIPVEQVTNRHRQLVGYVRVIDLHLQKSDLIDQVHPLMEISHNDTHLAALIHMQSQKEVIARVVNDQKATVGLVFSRQLTETFLQGK